MFASVTSFTREDFLQEGQRPSSSAKRWYAEPNCGFPAESDSAEARSWFMRQSTFQDEAKHEWINFLSKNQKDVMSKSSSLRSLVRKHGIIAQMRPRVWMEVTGAQKKMDENEGYYMKLLNVHSEQHAENSSQIELDLERTFPDHPHFKDEQSEGRQQLRRILTAYAWRNPLVAYCQSFNFIVGLLLLHLREEQAFWMMVVIIEDLLPANFYSPTLKGLRVDGKVLEEMVRERLPRLHSHFAEKRVDIATFTTGWLMRLYVDVFPIETTLRIWDSLFVEDAKMLFRVALAFMKLSEEELLRTQHVGEVLHFFNTNSVLLYDSPKLIKTCFSFYQITRGWIARMRNKYKPIVESQIIELEERRKQLLKRKEALQQQRLQQQQQQQEAERLLQQQQQEEAVASTSTAVIEDAVHTLNVSNADDDDDSNHSDDNATPIAQQQQTLSTNESHHPVDTNTAASSSTSNSSSEVASISRSFSFGRNHNKPLPQTPSSDSATAVKPSTVC